MDGGLTVQAGTHRIEHGALSPSKYRACKTDLEEQLAGAKEAGDNLKTEELEDQLDQLERYQSEARHAMRDSDKRCNDRFRIALARFKEGMTKEGQPGSLAFSAHLKEFLTQRGYKVEYSPPEGFVWDT